MKKKNEIRRKKKQSRATYFPDRYFERDGALFVVNSAGGEVQLTYNSLRCLSLIRTADSDSWSRELEIVDLDGVQHRLPIAAKDLASGGSQVVKQLLHHGLAICPGCEKDIVAYLCECLPKKRKFIVSSSGWVDGLDAFVLPDEVIGGLNSAEVVYAPSEDSSTQRAIRGQGSLEEWTECVADKATGNPLILFCLQLAFLGPLLKLLRLDGGRFHLFGASSRGKTTCLQVSASVWGDGADPGSPSAKPFACRWNMTANAIEGVAAVHNDMLTALDELGTTSVRDFGAAIYNLTSGQGKAVLNSARKLQKTRLYRGNILSCGEISVEAKIQGGGQRAMAGQLLRMIDVPISDDIFPCTGGQETGDFAVELKRSCSSFYGTAGPFFVRNIIDNLNEDRDDFMSLLDEGIDACSRLLAVEDAPPEQGRVIRRLAAVLVAGELAGQFGILPFDEDELFQAVVYVRDRWLEAQQTIADSDRAIRALRSFILRNHSALPSVQDALARINNCKGFSNVVQDRYFFSSEQLGFASNGFDHRTLARVLRDEGFLHTEESGRLKVGVKMASMKGKKVRLYAVRGSLLEASLGDDEPVVNGVDPFDDEEECAPEWG